MDPTKQRLLSDEVHNPPPLPSRSSASSPNPMSIYSPVTTAEQLTMLKNVTGHCQYRLALCFDTGEVIPRSPVEAFKHFQQAADLDHAVASYRMARYYEFGIEGMVERDFHRAVEYYRVSADQGYTLAQFKLALCFHQGLGVQKDAVQAYRYFRKAADQHHTPSQFRTAMCYRHGHGVGKDFGKAFQYFKLAAQHGNDRAEYELAKCYQTGVGVTPDQIQALQLYKASAEHGNISAMNILAGIYGDSSNSEHQVLALRYHKQLAKKGYSESLFSVGVCHDKGIGVAPNPVIAAAYYQMAADKGCRDAQYNLGHCYQFGKGVIVDQSKAFYYYQKSAASGCVVAQYHVGKCFDVGMGVEADEVEALRHYRLAADQNYAPSLCALGCFYDEDGLSSSGVVEKNAAEAFRLYSLSAQQDFDVALYNLGSCYELGKGVEKDYRMAFSCFERASIQRYITATQLNTVLDGCTKLPYD